ncbi:MAG: hypothetical protein ACI4F2_07475 [Acutalibacteraceae bacterium]
MGNDGFRQDEFDYTEPEQEEFEQEWQTVKQYDAMPVSFDSEDYDGQGGEEIAENGDEHAQRARKKRKLTGFQRTVKYQLIICTLAVIGVIAVKFISADLYQSVRSWYYEQLNSRLMITDVFNTISGNADEI